MKELICTITFVLLTFSLISAKQPTNVDPKTKEMPTGGTQTDMKTNMEKDDQDNINSALEEIMKQCNDSFTIDMSYVQALNDSGSLPDETDRTPKCYIRCVLEMSGVASPEGTYNPTRTVEVFGDKRGGKTITNMEDMVRSCTARNEKCKCERAYQYMKCIKEKEIAEIEKGE